MKLQEKLDAYKAEFLKKVPKETQAIMHRATEDLRHSGILERVLKVGDQGPDFALPNVLSRVISTSELRKGGPLAVCFYRGVW